MSVIRLSALALIATMLPLSAFAKDAAADDAPAAISNPGAPVTRGDFQAMLKATLEKNPELITDAMNAFRAKQEAKAAETGKEVMAQHKAELFNDKISPSAGNPKGDVTLIEFFDYHCGYCKQMLPTITRLLDEDKHVHVLFREFPILSPDSNLAARAALAVNQLNGKKYFEYYTALMKINGKFDEAALLDAAKNIGMDPDAVKKEMGEPVIDKILERNRKMAQDLNIHGTPALLVGDTLMPGAMSYDDLKKIVDKQRAGKSKAADSDASS